MSSPLKDRGDAGISDADENDNIAEIGQGVEDTLDSETEDRLNEEDGDGEENQKKGEEANKRGISRVDTNRVEVSKKRTLEHINSCFQLCFLLELNNTLF
jgi:hypothetical protein